MFLSAGESEVSVEGSICAYKAGKKKGGFTYGSVGRLVVNMDECAADIRQDLDLVLKSLTEIMGLPKGGVRVHHHVDFYVVIRSALSTSEMLAMGRDRHRATQGEPT